MSMKEKNAFSGDLVEVKVDLIEFEEDNICYVYSPAFELIGYGHTDEEAKESWKIVLEEYFQYARDKKTLLKDLEDHGWNIKQNNIELTPPTFSWMLEHNDQLSEVYNNHNFKKITSPIQFPLQPLYA